VSGGPRGERPSKEFLNFLTKFKKQRTHALTHATMGNTKYEHAVVTAHRINDEIVTTDTPLPLFNQFLEEPSASQARANEFNNTLLTSVDDFFFPELFEFELEPSSQKSDQSHFSQNNQSE